MVKLAQEAPWIRLRGIFLRPHLTFVCHVL